MKTPDLANAAVTLEKLANGSVTGDKVKDASLAGRDVLDDSLKGADIDESTLAGVGGGGVGAPEAWHQVGAGSQSRDLCADPSRTAVFCSELTGVEPAWYRWINYGGGFATAGFYRDQLGIVHLKGVVESTATRDTVDPVVKPIFRLPPAYAPANTRVFPTVGRNPTGQEVAQGRVDVRPNGLVVFEQDCEVDEFGLPTDCSADGGYVTLEGIAFRPDA